MKTNHIGLCIALSALCVAACSGSSDSSSKPNDIIVPSDTNKPDPDALAQTPKVTAMTPVSGKAGTKITISGANLNKASQVCFLDTCIDPDSVTESQVSATVPEGEGMVSVVLVVDNQRLNAGTFSYLTENDGEIDWCQMTYVASAIQNGQPVQAYAQVYEEGKTGANGSHKGIAAEFGHAVQGETNIEKFTWVPAQRNGEFSGEAAGSNDEYMASNVVLPDNGKYTVAFRFSLDGVHWKYCDATGSNDGFSTDHLMTVQTVAAEEEAREIKWCRIMNEPTTFASQVNQDSPAIYAQAFVPYCTPGDGICEGLTAQVGYGSPALSELSAIDANYTWRDATINAQYDGADSGKNHDEFMGSVKASEAGQYAIVYRMKLVGSDWVYCDTTDDTGFTVSDGMTWHVTDAQDNPGGDVIIDVEKKIEWCRVQYPESMDIRENTDSPTVYGRVYVPGCTDQNETCAELKGELGFGQYNTDATAFHYVSASLNATASHVGNNAEFMASLHPTAAGKYNYAYRFTLDDGKNWTYCDYDDDAGFDVAKAPVMNVSEDKDVIGWCRIQYPGEMTIEAGNDSGDIYGQVYVDGCTGKDKACEALKAQVGYGTGEEIENYTYSDATLNGEFQNPNNSEYVGQFNAPSAGNYNYVYRFTLDDGKNWTYCDFDDETGFDVANLGKLTVTEPPVEKKTIGWCGIVGNVSNTVANYNYKRANDPNYKHSNNIYAQVYVANCTEGDKKCESVKAQIGYGYGTDPATFTYSDAQYNSEAAAYANDEYMGKVFTKDDVRKEYNIAYRFSLDDGETWEYCDGDDEPGFKGQMPIVQYRNPKVDWCRVQYPGELTLKQGETAQVYGQIFVDGCTDEAGQCPFVRGALAWGKAAADLDQWAMEDAHYNPNFDESPTKNEEYVGPLTATQAVGDYKVLYRFTVDGGTHWTNCDYDDETGSNMANAAILHITSGEAPAPAEISQCKTLTENASVTESETISLKGRVNVSDKCTSQTGNACPNLKGYVAVGPQGSTNASEYTYYPATYDKDNGQSDEWALNNLQLAPGEYNALFAFSLDNGTTKTLCGTDGSQELNSGAHIVVTKEAKPITPFVRGKDFTCGLPVNRVDDVKALEEKDYYGQIWIPGCTGNGQNCDNIVGSHMHYAAAGYLGDVTTWNAVAATPNDNYSDPSNEEYMALTTINSPGTYKYMFSFDLKHDPNDADEEAQRVYCYINWAEYGDGAITVK